MSAESVVPITIVITRHVRPDCTAAFEAAIRAWIPLATQFPGHMGVLMLAPPPGGTEYGAVLKFRSTDDWEAFRAWPEYNRFLSSLQPLLAGEPRIEQLHGLEAWFRHPLGSRPPKRWKMALLTWMGVNVTALALMQTLRPAMERWPFVASFLVYNACVVGGLTYLVMPLMIRLFRRWVHAH